MIGALYLILEWSPFPGYFEPMATCWIQSAEWGIGGLKHYHEGATRIGAPGHKLWLYPLTRAQRIIEHAERQRPDSRHMLIAYHASLTRNEHGDRN